jgi:hypothetical protein
MALVAREDVSQRRTAQRIVEREARVAAEAEYDLDAMRAQHLDYRLGAGERSRANVSGLVHGGGYISAP